VAAKWGIEFMLTISSVLQDFSSNIDLASRAIKRNENVMNFFIIMIVYF